MGIVISSPPLICQRIVVCLGSAICRSSWYPSLNRTRMIQFVPILEVFCRKLWGSRRSEAGSALQEWSTRYGGSSTNIRIKLINFGGQYFNFKETPETLARKNFNDLTPLTSGSKPGDLYITSLLIIAVHGYSLLRTQLNNDYFHDLYDESAKFGIEIEGHRESIQFCDTI